MMIKIKATEPQHRFHALTCRFPAFVGGYGSGKTQAMCNQAIIDASESPNALISLYEPTYDLVRLSLAPRLQEKLEEHGIRYVYNKSENTIKTKNPQFGNFILRSLDNPARIVAYESYRAHVDELDTLPKNQARQVWIKIIARNRQKPKGLANPLNRVSAYTSPEGFMFVYDQWVKNKGADYELIQASSRSNPFLPADYIPSLIATYPPELVDAYVEGKFVNLRSGTIYKSFDRVAHNSPEIVKENEPLFIGLDFNVGKMAASIFVKRVGGTQWHIVSELTDVFDTPDMARIIKEKYQQQGHRITIYPDASGGSRKSVNASTSDIALLQQAGFEVRAKASNPAVKDRVNAVNAAFNRGAVFVNTRACPNVANCLEQQTWDSNGEPDKKAGVDHQNDATGYVIAYEMPIHKPIGHINISF